MVTEIYFVYISISKSAFIFKVFWGFRFGLIRFHSFGKYFLPGNLYRKSTNPPLTQGFPLFSFSHHAQKNEVFFYTYTK